jgi:type I restriction enzyme M protein
MFEQAFKNINDTLHKDAGCGSELDYVEQSSWILFLKYLDDFETDRSKIATLEGKTYTPLIADEYRWNTWACPKKDGKLDHHRAPTGEDLIKFVNEKLFPYLKQFKHDAEHSETIEYKIGEIFSELRNRIQSGYNLRNVLDIVDGLKFQTSEQKHEMSHLYEGRIQKMGNAGRNGGEYYTPRPLIRTIVKVLHRLSERRSTMARVVLDDSSSKPLIISRRPMRTVPQNKMISSRSKHSTARR